MTTVWRPVDDEFMSWPATLIGLVFALAFASWATDQAIMQHILAARSRRDAQMAPLVGGIAKLAVPPLTVIPGMTASVLLPDLETPATAVFELILHLLPDRARGRRVHQRVCGGGDRVCAGDRKSTRLNSSH